MPKRKTPDVTTPQSGPLTVSAQPDTEERRRVIAEYIETLKALIASFRNKVQL